MKPISVADVLEFAKSNAGRKLTTIHGRPFTISPSPRGGVHFDYGRSDYYAAPSPERIAIYLDRFNSLSADESSKPGNFPSSFGGERSYMVATLVVVRAQSRSRNERTDRNWYQMAFRTWPILIKAAAERQPVKYGAVGRTLGIHHRLVRHALGPIHDYCMAEGLPPLTILVEDWKGKVGSGFHAWALDNAQAGRERVYSYRWYELPNPFSFAAEGATPKGIAKEIVSGRVKAQDAYALVRVRGMAQLVFREAILRAYEGRCAISGDRGEPLLEAAHILPWGLSTAAQRLDLRNGMLLSLLYHRLFDLGWISIDDEYRVRVNFRKFKQHRLSIEQHAALAKIDGRRLRLPRNTELWPDRKLLAKRRRQVRP